MIRRLFFVPIGVVVLAAGCGATAPTAVRSQAEGAPTKEEVAVASPTGFALGYVPTGLAAAFDGAQPTVVDQTAGSVEVPREPGSQPITEEEGKQLLDRRLIGSTFFQVLVPDETAAAARSGDDPLALHRLTADVSAPFIRVALAPADAFRSERVAVDSPAQAASKATGEPSSGRLRRTLDNGYVIDVLYRNVVADEAARVAAQVEVI